MNGSSFSFKAGDNVLMLFSLEMQDNVNCGLFPGGVIGSCLIGRGGGFEGGIKGAWGEGYCSYVIVLHD